MSNKKRPATSNKIARDLTCPHCNQQADGEQGIAENTTPANGDFSVCAHCGDFVRFVVRNRRCTLVKASADALDRAVRNGALERADIIAMHMASRAVRKFGPPGKGLSAFNADAVDASIRRN